MAERDPWAEFQDVSTAPPALRPLTPPRQPPPVRPEEAEGTVLRNTRTQQEIEAAERQEVRQPQQQRFENETQLQTRFRGEPLVRAYEQTMPTYVSVMYQTPDTRAGDLSLIYGTANILDPGAVVRESDSLLVQQTAALDERIIGAVRTLNGGGELTPETRSQIREMLRSRQGATARNYNRIRQDYIRSSQRFGFDARTVVGTHPARPYREQFGLDDAPEDEERGPGVGGVPLAHNLPSEPGNPFTSEQQAAYDAFIDANPRATAEQFTGFFSSIGLDPARYNIDALARDAASGRPLARGSTAQFARPDISDMRGGADPNLPPEQRQAAADRESADALVRAGANAVTLGGADYIAGGLNSVFRGGSLGDNIRREQAVSDYDAREHTGAVVTGSLAGGLVLPTAALAEAKTAAMAAMRSGLGRDAALSAARSAAGRRLAIEGGAYGGVHGALTGEGDLQDRVADAALEAVIGSTTAYGGVRLAPRSVFGGRRIATRSNRPPLIDPASGRLNQPLESASPAERVGAANAYGIDLPLGAAGDRPAAIIEKGLDILPPSAGVMNDARRATGEQVTQGLEGVAARYGTAESNYAMGQEAQRGAQSWINRAQGVRGDPADRGVVGRAYDRVPIAGDRPAVANSTRTALNEMLDVFRSNPRLREIFQNQRLQRYLDALTPPHSAADEVGDRDALGGVLRTVGRTTEQQPGQISWEDLKHFRSIIGEEIGEVRFSDSPLKSQLRRLYGALSEDMRATATAQGPRALRAFERANNLNRDVETRIESALVHILGDDSRNNPEAAAQAIRTIARSGRGSSNIDQLHEIRNSLRKGGAWDQVASALIRLGGQPTNSEGRSFNPQTFINWYSDMSEPARAALFGGGRRAELRKALDGFVEVSQRLAGTDALRNTSMTAPGFIGAGTVGGLATQAGTAMTAPLTALGSLMALGATAYANNRMAHLWTSPAFVRWATGYTRAAGRATGGLSPSTLVRRREALARLARTEPSIAAEIGEVDRALFGESGPEMGPEGTPDAR